MKLALVAALLAAAILSPSTSRAQQVTVSAAKAIEIEVCNTRSDDIAVTFADFHIVRTDIEGWYDVGSSSCVIFQRPTSASSSHFLFFRGPNLERLAASTTTPSKDAANAKVFLLAGGNIQELSVSSATDDAFCIDWSGPIDLFESIVVDTGRTKNCRDREQLARASVTLTGGMGEARSVEVGSAR